MNKIYSSPLSVLLLAVACGTIAADAGPTSRKGLVKNLVTDYGAGVRTNEIADLLQKAVDNVGAAGGGTIVIPGRVGSWQISRPVLVGYPNVTIAGEGAGTRLFGADVMFILGLKEQYRRPITAGHHVALAGLLDASVKEKRYGLRTFDGKTPAAGYFQHSPLAFAGKVANDPSGNYWKDYARGAGKPTYWANHNQYTINLAVRNNGRGRMRGTICGVGPGGLTAATTRATIEDPLDVWTIESDGATGKDLRFRFRLIDAAGKESIQSLSLAPEGAGPGLHRISVQLDFVTGRCRAWYSASADTIQKPLLTARLDLPRGCRLKAFEYGAFRLGRVVASPFAGSPCDGGPEGDWTYCGLSLFETLRYSTDGGHDKAGATQTALEPKATANDAYRLFPQAGAPGLVAFLPLTVKEPQVLVPVKTGNSFGGRVSYGFWLPMRAPNPIPGTLGLRDLQMFGGIAVGEARHVRIANVYQGGGGYYHGVGTLNGGPSQGLLEVRNCRLIGQDAALYNYGRELRVTNLSGGGGELLFRFVGGRGAVDNVIITGFVAADYYVKLHAGAVGGPLRLSQFCSDNEGLSFVPKKACFYAEPSLDGGREGNRLTLRGSVYTGALHGRIAVLELADPPGPGPHEAEALVEVDGIDLWAGKEKLDSVILCHTRHWGGRLLAQDAWVSHTANGLVHFTGTGQCRVVSIQESDSLPKEGSWLAGCNVIRIPDRHDPRTGAWIFTTYRCVRSGTYGTGQEPEWREVKDK